MSKSINVNLHQETDGIKAHLEIIEKDVVATINFKVIPYFPLILNENNLREMKQEIDILLKKINQVKKELNPSPIKKVVNKKTK